MAGRKHLTVNGDIQELVKSETARRNEKLEIGERRYTIESVTEEAILYWANHHCVVGRGGSNGDG